MPPTNVEFPKGERDGSLTVSAEEPDNLTYIEVRPIIGFLGVVPLISPCSSVSGVLIWPADGTRLQGPLIAAGFSRPTSTSGSRVGGGRCTTYLDGRLLHSL